MRKLNIKIILFLLFPIFHLLLSITLYFISDPFLDWSKPNNYSWKYRYQSLADLSTKKLLASKYHYNSFILGSSRTTGVYGCYLQTKFNHSQFFHYANWEESIGGIANKLQVLDSMGYDINNLIIYLDVDNTFKLEGLPRDYDHYLVTKKSKFQYYKDHFLEYLKFPEIQKFKTLFTPNKLTTFENPNWNSDLITNDANHQCPKAYDNSDALNYNQQYINKENYHPKVMEDQITNVAKEYMLKMASIINKHQSNTYIVITPLVNQCKFSEKDLALITSIFGSTHVFDFSGANYITTNADNYFKHDQVHFLDIVSKKIIDSCLNR